MAARYGRAYREARRRIVREAVYCYWCGREISDDLPAGHPQKATADHVIPVVHGGAHSPENLVPACARCNSSRGKRGTDWRPSPRVPGSDDW